MTDRPIIFSAPMVRALLNGRKTQTRRVLKPQPWPDHRGALHVSHPNDMTRLLKPPYAPGDRLWVREAWATVNGECGPGWAYRSNGEFIQPDYDGPDFGAGPSFDYEKYPGAYTMWFGDLLSGVEGHGWTPSIHMPRWASRLTLTVTDVRVQRVQEISGEDAISEGIEVPRCGCEVCARSADMCPADASEAIMAFAHLWDSLNAKRGFGWDANPWCCALTFTVEHRNIDAD